MGGKEEVYREEGTKEGIGVTWHRSRREDNLGEGRELARGRRDMGTSVRGTNKNRCNDVYLWKCHS